MWCSSWPSESAESAVEGLTRMQSYEECAREIEFQPFLKYDDLQGYMWQHY